MGSQGVSRSVKRLVQKSRREVRMARVGGVALEVMRGGRLCICLQPGAERIEGDVPGK